MSEKTESAFPYVGSNGDVFGFGMSLRDYFAGQAMAGLCAVVGVDFGGAKGASEVAYKIADAMMEARK